MMENFDPRYLSTLPRETFSQRNRRRCESPQGFNHALSSWSLSDWMTALTGEVGEAANIIKKLNRIRDGAPGNRSYETEDALRRDLAKELGDCACYLDLLAQAAGFDLETVRDAKFAEVSQRMGYSECQPPLKPAESTASASKSAWQQYTEWSARRAEETAASSSPTRSPAD